MDIESTIETKVLKNQLRFFIYTVIYILTVAGATFYLMKSSYPILSLIFCVSAFMFPVFFPGAFRKFFLIKGEVTLKRYSISVLLTDIADERNVTISFSDIRQFQTFASEQNDFATLKLELINGQKLKYIFTGQINNDKNNTDINNQFKNLVLEYNKQRETTSRITMAPSFWATKSALYVQRMGGFLALSVTAWYGYKVPETLLVAIGFVPLYLSITHFRKRALKERDLFS